MHTLNYKKRELYLAQIPIIEIINKFATPCYIYDKSTIEENWLTFDNAFGNYPHRICYAVKANSNLSILKILAKLGSGFDIVSQGELERVIAAGGDPKKVVFSGVGKKESEIARALEVGIACFNVESEMELERINNIAARLNKVAPISLRINPDIDAKTHPYIATGLIENKFGIDYKEAFPIVLKTIALPNLQLTGIACHIGSQLTEMAPFIEALDKTLAFIAHLKDNNINVQHINLGGGLGVRYQEETPPQIFDYVNTLKDHCKEKNLEIIIEPGRAIVANAGILITRVEFLKHHHQKNFAIVDAAMNDLIRPALYDAWHNILPLQENNDAEKIVYDVVGPVCETADFIAKNRALAIQPGDLLAVTSAGAYGFSMSSNYNSRPRIAEVMVDNDQFYLIRKRETIEDLYALEKF